MSTNEKKAAKVRKKAEKRNRKGRKKLCAVTVFFPDHTYLAREVEIKESGTILIINGQDYQVKLDTVQKQIGWWPFKPRSIKRTIFKDEFYCLDYSEGNQQPISLIDQMSSSEYTTMSPAMLKSMTPEQMFRDTIQSMKNRSKVQLNPKILLLFAGLAVAGVLIGHYVLGIF